MNFLSPDSILDLQIIFFGLPTIVIGIQNIKDLLPIIKNRDDLEQDWLQCWLLVSQRPEI